MDYVVLSILIHYFFNDKENRQGKPTWCGERKVALSILIHYFFKDKDKGKVNQLDVGNEKDQHNTSGKYNPRTSTNMKNKTRCTTIRASDESHRALRTSKQ